MKLEQKHGMKGIVKKLAEEVSGSELTSLLLEVFRIKTLNMKTTALLRQYKENRFAAPAPVDIVGFKQYELVWLSNAQTHGFDSILLSPLTPFGSSSALGPVNQNNIVSTIRGMEVVSDATNVLALEAAKRLKNTGSESLIKLCTTHRLTRSQYFKNPAFSAHFGIFTMITAGLDEGNYTFERDHLSEHLLFYTNQMLKDFSGRIIIKVFNKNLPDLLIEKLMASVNQLSDRIEILHETSDDIIDYYKTVRIKIFVEHDNQEIHLTDMGFVDWTQKLLNNKKHRCLTSGIGLESAYKVRNNLI